MKKNKIKESTEIIKKLPRNIVIHLGELRESLINFSNVKPFEASFIASMVGELILHGMLEPGTGNINYPLNLIQVHTGFSSIISRLMNTSNWDKDLSNLNIKMTYDNPDFRHPPTAEEIAAGAIDDRSIENKIRAMDEQLIINGYDVLREFIEKAVLANREFTNNFKYYISNDGIVTLEKIIREEVSEDTKEKDFSELLIPVDKLKPTASEKLAIVRSKFTNVVAYDNNWVTIGFNATNRDEQKDLNTVYSKVFKDEYKVSKFAYNSNMASYLNNSWCTLHPSSGGSRNFYNRNNDINTVSFLTISLRPLNDLYDDFMDSISVSGRSEESLTIARNRLFGEIFMYNPTINKDTGKITHSIHSMRNYPYMGHWYPTQGSYLVPKITYNYDDIPFTGITQQSIDKIKLEGDFIVNNENVMTDYIGKKDTIVSLIVPGHVRALEFGAIHNFRKLETLVLSPSVTVIKRGAIKNCPKLKYIQVSDRLRIIENYAIDEYGVRQQVTIGVFERKGDKINVRPPKNLEYLDIQYLLDNQNFNNLIYDEGGSIKTDSILKNQLTNPIDTFSNNQLFKANNLKINPNSLALVNTKDLAVDSLRRIEYIDLSKYSKVFNIPTGIEFLKESLFFDKDDNIWSTEKTIINRSGYPEDLDFELNLPFSTEELIINPVTSAKPRVVPIIKGWPQLRRVSINSMDFLKLTSTIRAAEDLYIYINPVNRFKTNWAKHLVIREGAIFKRGAKTIVTNDPLSLYNALKVNNKNIDNLIIKKGNSLEDIDGEVNKDQLALNKVVIMESKYSSLPVIKSLILESVYNNVEITSYTQLIRQLKQLNTLDTKQLESILDKLDFIPDKTKEYRNTELDISYIQLPVVIDSDIKVKLVRIDAENGIILALPNNIVASYETLEDSPEELDIVNKNLILYAEVVGFDTDDTELHEIIKKAYLSAGDSLGAFATQYKEEPEETEELEDLGEFDNLPSLDSIPDNVGYEPLEDFSTEELNTNFESFKKFKARTNSLSKLIKSIKENSPTIVTDNLRLAKLSNLLVIEVNNKNIYNLLEATPNLGKTILNYFGEYIKNYNNIQLVESYNSNGKRYFVVAEQVSNNFWYTEQDNIETLSNKDKYIVPKKDRLIKLKSSNIRLAERKVVPKNNKNNIVFVKGGK